MYAGIPINQNENQIFASAFQAHEHIYESFSYHKKRKFKTLLRYAFHVIDNNDTQQMVFGGGMI